MIIKQLLPFKSQTQTQAQKMLIHHCRICEALLRFCILTFDLVMLVCLLCVSLGVIHSNFSCMLFMRYSLHVFHTGAQLSSANNVISVKSSHGDTKTA